MGVASGQIFPGRFAPGCLLQHPPSLNPGYATGLCLAIVKKTSHLIVTTHNYTHYLPTLFVAFLWLVSNTGPQSWAHLPPCSQEPISLPELLRSEQDSPGCIIELEAILTSRLLLSSMYLPCLLKTSIVLHASPTF